MSEVNSINLKDIKFTRDVKVDYQNGNPIINSVFRQFDKPVQNLKLIIISQLMEICNIRDLVLE